MLAFFHCRLLKKQFFHRALKVMKKKPEKDAKKEKEKEKEKAKGDSSKEEEKKGKKEKEKKKESEVGETKKEKSVSDTTLFSFRQKIKPHTPAQTRHFFIAAGSCVTWHSAKSETDLVADNR